MMNEEQSDRIIDKLDTLIKITMATAFKDKTKEERILMLLDLGIQRKEVADIVGTPVQYVDNIKHQAKKGQKKRKPRGKQKKEVEQK
jgi:hypothetical protein